MKEITDLRVKQFRIFGADRIPFLPLKTALGQKAMIETYSWREFGENPPTRELIYNGGVFQPPDAPPILINNLQISDRRIVLEVTGNTEQAAAVFVSIAQLLERYDSTGVWKNAQPVVVTNETTCVVTLDFDWDLMFSWQFVEFSKGLTKKFSSHSAVPEIAGVKCGIVFSFDVKNPEIQRHGITLSNKSFTVEPRANTPLSQRRFLTASPTDSGTHLELLRTLETILCATSSNGETKRSRRSRK